jgi:hypothetical protein
MREDQRTRGPAGRRRLPGFEEPARSSSPGSGQSARLRTGYDWDARGDDLDVGYAQRRHVRESGIRASRRASGWTAAALIATVAATTGYLAHSIPGATTSASTTSTGIVTHAGKSTAVRSGAPAVNGPVVTSGGSGVASGSAAGAGG